MLHLYPKNVYLGVGCRKNTPEEKIETQIQKYLSEHGIAAEQIILAASIDLKKEEPGLLAFCEKYHLPFVTYRGEELEKAKGTLRHLHLSARSPVWTMYANEVPALPAMAEHLS